MKKQMPWLVVFGFVLACGCSVSGKWTHQYDDMSARLASHAFHLLERENGHEKIRTPQVSPGRLTGD